MLSRTLGFDAGKLGRRLKAIPTSRLAINSTIRTYGANTVARSRYLAANNAYASAARDSFVSALVGAGIKPSSLVADPDVRQDIMELWLRWTDEADADGLTDFYGLQALIATEMFEAGECFVRFRPRFVSDGLSVPLQLQVIPSEMLPLDHNELLTTGRIECGIEFDQIGRRVAYHFYRTHPGELLQSYTLAQTNTLRVRVPAEEVLHLFRPMRAGQIRGFPHTVAGIVTLALLDLYDDAELERKRTAALFGGFVTRPKPEVDEDSPFTGAPTSPHAAPMAAVSDFSLEPGALVDLDLGADIKFSEPADVGSTYEGFQYRNLLRAAAGFGVPYADMTGDLRQTSYGSIRAGVINHRRRIEAMQHQVVVFQFCRPVWQKWFDAAMTVGALLIDPADYAAEKAAFQKVKWIPPKWDWIDPLKDRMAEKLAVDAGFKPRSEVVEAEGYDPEEIDSRIKADQERASRLGIKFISLRSEVLVSPDDDAHDLFVESGASQPHNTPDESGSNG